MDISVTYLWLTVGVLMLTAEALGVSGVGLMFGGLGCLTVGALLTSGTIEMGASLMQFIVFFLSTAVWAALLWKPLSRFYSGKRAGGYSNMIGEMAYVGSQGLRKGHVGEATWSGTIMKATLSDHSSVDSLEAGTPVIITEVKGITLTVKPKP